MNICLNQSKCKLSSSLKDNRLKESKVAIFEYKYLLLNLPSYITIFDRYQSCQKFKKSLDLLYNEANYKITID